MVARTVSIERRSRKDSMKRFVPTSLLGAACCFASISFAASLDLEVITAFDPAEIPESVTTDDAGNLYVSIGNTIRQRAANGTYSVFGTLPIAAFALGVKIGPPIAGAAMARDDAEAHRSHRMRRTKVRPETWARPSARFRAELGIHNLKEVAFASANGRMDATYADRPSSRQTAFSHAARPDPAVADGADARSAIRGRV
jgi:hypothetical protein